MADFSSSLCLGETWGRVLDLLSFPSGELAWKEVVWLVIQEEIRDIELLMYKSLVQFKTSVDKTFWTYGSEGGNRSSKILF